MKFFYTALFFCINLSFLTSQNTIVIPAQSTKVFEEKPPKDYQVFLKNKSKEDLDVRVVDRVTEEQQKGFGLSGKADIGVEETNMLVLQNNSQKAIEVEVDFKKPESKKSSTTKKKKSISFTLRNNSIKSIPLIIPTVMNPNLSPMSNSGVTLKIGQKIYFKKGWRKYLLLEVDESIEEDSKLDVAQLLKDRKKELGI